jgi:Uma2 family endonuclease
MTWNEVVSNSSLAELPFKIETNEFGQVVLCRPKLVWHSIYQEAIQGLLRKHLKGGRVPPECPIETRKGVKVADVAWMSIGFLRAHLGEDAFLSAPEICIEVISPSNTINEIKQKRKLYLERGALEVWTCDLKGNVQFFNADGELEQSSLAPKFPKLITLDLE